jgi:hypothetical protein
MKKQNTLKNRAKARVVVPAIALIFLKEILG